MTFNKVSSLICCLIAAIFSAPVLSEGLVASTEYVAITQPSDQLHESDPSRSLTGTRSLAQPDPVTTPGTDTARPELTVTPAISDNNLANYTPASSILQRSNIDPALTPDPVTSATTLVSKPRLPPTPTVIELNTVDVPPAVVIMHPADFKPDLTSDSSLSYADLWQRIRKGFAMQELDSSLIARQEKWYENHPDYVERMSERARRYLYFIVSEVEKRGMPTEIALLPMIESAFKPDARSASSAVGIWQFIPSTGKHFGLEQNWWHDERRDIVSATKSALDYLQTLHDQFGDWQLALAAYNWGENAVERAQEYNRRHNRPTDYSHLNMPSETRNYVPKLLAVKNIVNDPAKFGLTLEDIPDKPYFTAVNPSRHMDVKIAAKLAEMPLEDFIALNPSHNRPVILQNDDTPILLPVDKVDTFMNNMDIYDKPLVSWEPYQTRKGERLDKLAARFDISVADLRSANGIASYIKISDGRKLLVPADNSNNTQDSDFEAFNTYLPPTLADRHVTTHLVRRGETLGSISRRYHISIAALKRQNHNSSLIRPGQRLLVAGAAARARSSSTTIHIVRRGETLSSIAKHYHISVAALKSQNGNSSMIHPGQRLLIASSNSPTQASAGRIKVAFNP